MPELPEVQTVINSIKHKLINKRIINYNIFNKKICYNKDSTSASKKLINQRIISVSRLGKNIIIKLSTDYIIFHLRMTGYLYHSKKLNVTSKHLRYSLFLSDKSYLHFEDIRKFGGFFYLTNLKDFKKKIGLDPFNSNFTKIWLYKTLKLKRAKIKPLLLRQDYICGLGNIYIDEILWKSKINPKKEARNINKTKAISLHENIMQILKDSISHHGTTFMNFKFDAMKTGDYKKKLNAYGRKNKNCRRCSQSISITKISGRTTYYCKNCQR